MDINEGTTTDDLWTPYKELVAVVEGYLTRDGTGSSYAVHTFEAVLRRHKQSFLALLKNPPKNPANREEIRRGITEGVNLPSVGRTLLSKELVEEAIILSDMYSVNEYLSLELVLTAQRQTARHPGLPRGLVAVLLYYDGRRALAQALKDLVMARDGVCWSITAREEIIKYVSRYVEQLISDGLLSSTLDALRGFTLGSELALLQGNRALPPRGHYDRLVGTIEGTRKLLAGVLFAASAQRGLNRDILMRLLSEQIKTSTIGPTGCLDDVSLAHHMALLYALDLSVLHRREDGEELSKQLPLIRDPELISVLLDELTCTQESEKPSGPRALCQLALGLALGALKRAPQSLLRAAQFRSELLDQDDALVDAALDGQVFEYLDEAVLSSELIVKEEYYQRRLHTLITDFIVLMHSKLMEMRVKADEAARTVQMYASEGITAPSWAGGAGAVAGAGAGAGAGARSRLDALLRCVQKLYAQDPLDLRLDYWAACEAHHSHTYRSGGRSATLYKFVRCASSLPSASLLPAWLRALAALAAPRHTWALLARPPLSASHLLRALAQYKQNLCVDSNPFPEQFQAPSMGASAIVTPAARPGRLLVRQEEVEAMVAALKLIAAVATQDQAACTAICENLQWDAVNVMFGLICCHVPLHLKAELCLTLSALGGNANTAARVWTGMEAAQLLSTNKDMRSLSTDLHQIECRIEEYPLTRAFLTLLSRLTASAPPPRFAVTQTSHVTQVTHVTHATYVTHVVQAVLLPAPHRPYAKACEKWQVISLSLHLLVQWVSSYTPSAADFPSPPPGLHVALRLHSGDDLLRLVFNTLAEAVEVLPVKGPQQRYVEECLIHCLQLIEKGLELERALVAAAAEAGRSVLIVGLSKLILGGSGSAPAPPLLHACRALSGGTSRGMSRVSAAALGLLRRAARSPAAANHLLPAVQGDAVLVRHGFVECLEAEEWLESEAEAAREAKEGVLAIIHQTLPNAAPNFAHFLLGYQMTEDVSRSSLHEAGVNGFPRTCLHSILDMLDQHIAAPDHSDREASALIESCYKLVYQLCARPSTSGPVLRFLRAREHFLSRHIKATVNLESAHPRTISARSWLSRACACELGASSASRHHVLQALCCDAERRHQEWERCLLRRLLSPLPVSVEAAAEPRWELFHPDQLRQCIAQCDLPTGLGGKRISVSRVHATLARELLALQATAAQRNLVADEIQKVLDYVTEVNRRRNLAATITHYYDSWRQLTEILFCVAPTEILDVEAKKNLLLDILQDLLNKIPPAEVLPQLGNLASGTILLLMVNLRHCYILQKRDSTLKSADFEASFFGPSTQMLTTKSLTLKFILHKILSWILVSGASTQKMRVNLYGALLNYLNIVNLRTSPAEIHDPNETYVSRLDSSKGVGNKEESALKSMVIDVISEFGDNLCSIVCNDCIGGGHDVCRMVALSCLDTLIEINPQTDWMKTLTDQGYLRSLIDSLLQDDEGLQQALEPNPKSLRVLYVYESKMALLMKISSTTVGAGAVLSGGALSCLANMRVLDSRPDVHAPTQRDAFLPDLDNRFRQILIPALSLCSALLTTLGTQNHSCVVHVLHFLLSHLECVDILLRAAHPNSPTGLLLEVEALTSVIGRASNREVFGTARTDSALAAAAPAAERVRGLMLALLPRFVKEPEGEDEMGLYHRIVCNLLTYARNILERDSSRVLFRPALAPETTPESPEAGPNCGAILELVQSSVRRCHAQTKLLATVNHQLQNVPTMTLEDMKKLLPPGPPAAPSDVRLSVVSLLSARVHARRRALQYCRHATEAALYLVWTHVHVYLRVVPPQGDRSGALTVATALRGASGNDLSELRKGLVAVFNERFAEQLLDTAKDQSPAQRCFLEVLLKDIKSMIQFSPL